MTQSQEIEITKEANGLTYILFGELNIDYYESPYKEENPAYQCEEVDRYVSMPWVQVQVPTDEGTDMELMWDATATKPQLKFFNEEINAIEI
jgi:hypothetical protein